MKRYALFPILTLICGGMAFFLRFLQFQNGFEANGLPISGNPPGLLLLLLLALSIILPLFLRNMLPADDPKTPPAFPDAFAVPDAVFLTPAVMGLFLLAASGVLDLLLAFSDRMQRDPLLFGVMSILSALCLFSGIPAFRKKETSLMNPPISPDSDHPDDSDSRSIGNRFLVPVVCSVIRLVLVYRQDSMNPALMGYYTEILALMFLALALFRLSSFAFQIGQTRRFVLYSIPAAVLCAAVLAEGHPLSTTLFYAGNLLFFLGLLLQRSWVLAHSPEQPKQET